MCVVNLIFFGMLAFVFEAHVLRLVWPCTWLVHLLFHWNDLRMRCASLGVHVDRKTTNTQHTRTSGLSVVLHHPPELTTQLNSTTPQQPRIHDRTTIVPQRSNRRTNTNVNLMRQPPSTPALTIFGRCPVSCSVCPLSADAPHTGEHETEGGGDIGGDVQHIYQPRTITFHHRRVFVGIGARDGRLSSSGLNSVCVCVCQIGMVLVQRRSSFGFGLGSREKIISQAFA